MYAHDRIELQQIPEGEAMHSDAVEPRHAGVALSLVSAAMRRAALAGCLAFLLFVVAPARSATIAVSPSGSPGTVTLQQAAIAARAGDELVLQAGVYDQAYEPVELPGLRTMAQFRVPVTIRAAEGAEVIIGPENQDEGVTGLLFYFTAGPSRMEGVTLRNCGDGVFAVTGLTVVDCSFERNKFGFATQQSLGHQVMVEDSRFSKNEAAVFGGFESGPLLVRRCVFTDNLYGIDSSRAPLVRAESCTIRHDGVSVSIGVQSSFGSRVEVRDTVIEGVSTGITTSLGSTLEIQDSTVRASFAAAITYGNAPLVALRCEFSSSGHSTIIARDYNSVVQINFCHISPGTERTVLVEHPAFGPILEYDFRHNWWGTSDASAIASSILDHHDDTSLGAVILFEPFEDMPVATEGTSIGELKRRY